MSAKKPLQFLLASFLFTSVNSLSTLEAEGLVRYGFCTEATASNDCSWMTNCNPSRVACESNIYNPSQPGRLFLVNYVATNQDVVNFAGVGRSFLRYFENVSSLIVRDERLEPPVRWTLNNGIANMPNLGNLFVFSREGGLYGTLPQRFATTSPFNLVINGSVEGTLPEAWVENARFNFLKINSHRLVGTIPAAYSSHYFTHFDVSSLTGELVGDNPEPYECTLSTAYSSGAGNNGGLFCKCSTQCVANTTTGGNACYNYETPGIPIDSCATVTPLSGCALTKQTMRYGTLCYDVCANGCEANSYCGVDFSGTSPAFRCMELVVDTFTPTSSFNSETSGVSLVSATLLSLWL